MSKNLRGNALQVFTFVPILFRCYFLNNAYFSRELIQIFVPTRLLFTHWEWFTVNGLRWLGRFPMHRHFHLKAHRGLTLDQCHFFIPCLVAIDWDRSTCEHFSLNITYLSASFLLKKSKLFFVKIWRIKNWDQWMTLSKVDIFLRRKVGEKYS